MKLILFILLCLPVLPILAQEEGKYIREGNNFYKKNQMDLAAASYNKAASSKYKYIALMNKGNALYKQKKYDEAIKAYRQVSENKEADVLLRSGAYYNTGVIYSSQQKLQESIQLYIKALLLNDKDRQARENLQKALLEQKFNNSNHSENRQQNQQQSRMNKDQAQQQLNKLEQKEKHTQEKLSKDKSQYGGSAGKDW
jgi:Ca-activated chloride channel homolog